MTIRAFDRSTRAVILLLTALGVFSGKAQAAPLSGESLSFDEKTLTLGGKSGWDIFPVRENMAELAGLRPTPVLALSSGSPKPEVSENQGSFDMRVSFDEDFSSEFRDAMGNYTLNASGRVVSAGRKRAREGKSAALFSGGASLVGGGGVINSGNSVFLAEPVVITPSSKEAVFSPGRKIEDFSIEFWLYSDTVEIGETVFSWTATHRSPAGKESDQSIRLMADHNRFEWTFLHFFTGPSDEFLFDVTLSGLTPVVPKTWTHHLVRFNSSIGLLEYLVNGEVEDAAYTTATGVERYGGAIYQPAPGERGRMALGGRFSGLIDEFRVHKAFVESQPSGRYPETGGVIESAVLDLGSLGSSVRKISAAAGHTNYAGKDSVNHAVSAANYSGGPFADDSEAAFFLRVVKNRWAPDGEWIPFTPGAALSGIKGRFIQVKALLFPSADKSATPYIEKIDIVYDDPGPPPPPERLAVTAGDGEVELSWRTSEQSRHEEVKGFVVYYGTESGVYFGRSPLCGDSPVDIGGRTSFSVKGLENGKLYFFAVAAYDEAGSGNQGPLSREITGRPLRRGSTIARGE